MTVDEEGLTERKQWKHQDSFLDVPGLEEVEAQEDDGHGIALRRFQVKMKGEGVC